MFFSRWTLFQAIAILLLVLAAFVVDLFKQDIGVSSPASNTINLPVIMTSVFIVVVTGLFSLLFYFQTKKSGSFFKHRLWENMHIIMPILFGLFLVVIFSGFLIQPLSDFMQQNRWTIYVFIYAFLFLTHLTVLAIIHQVEKHTISSENKVSYSFVWTSLGMIVLIFLL